ncbi:hypothetical protein GW17_00041061 [Ensete ventricosum]|nr:hypothetical protein GW17_00041061 [Ensete ventricosum]
MRTARYRTVPPKSTVGDRLREKKGRRRRGKEERRKKKEEEKKKNTSRHPRLRIIVAGGSPERRHRPCSLFFSRAGRKIEATFASSICTARYGRYIPVMCTARYWYHTGIDNMLVHRYGPVSKTFLSSKGEKGKKKMKRKRRKKKKRRRRPFPAPSPPAGRPRVVLARAHPCPRAILLPCEETERLPARGERSR